MMGKLTCCYVVFLSLLSMSRGQTVETKQQGMEKNMEKCKSLEKDPYFEPELVVGQLWRIYYTWNMKIDDKCLDLAFKNVTPKTIQRIWGDMHDYVAQQPYWESATLHVTMGPARRELLLFPAQGPAGSFLGVPNVIREGGITPMRGGVPLFRFQLKLMYNGKYLLMSDCHIGMTSLLANPSSPPYSSDIAIAVAQLELGDGFPACTQERNKEELVK